MNINKGNIDEHLFEYFEGLMSPTQADALMDFIHQNPEFEKDFVQWKKAYHHKDQVMEDYGIATKIKSNIRFNTGINPLYLGGILAIGLVFGWLINSASKINFNESSAHLTLQKETQNILNEKLTESNTATKDKNIVLTKSKSKIVIQENDVRLDTEQTKTVDLKNPFELKQPFFNEYEDTETYKGKSIEEEEHTPLEEPDLLVTELDSSLEVHEKKASIQKKKYKGKRKGVFSTTDKILPVNSNF